MDMLLQVAITPNRGMIIQPPAAPGVFVGDFGWWRQASVPLILSFRPPGEIHPAVEYVHNRP